tara:strand:+ start:1661 stop:2263 length:603 start_codon:yes stop_codon:yes gene_type:complete
MEKIFTDIYKEKKWENNKDKNIIGTGSGPGSTVEYNEKYIKILKKIINDYNINNIVDLGCGDFRIGKLLYDDINVTYTGYDTYKDIINYHKSQHSEPKYNFKHLDFFTYKESIIEGDICILKDVLQHWSLDEVYLFLDYLTESKKFKYILIINCSYQKEDNKKSSTGGFMPLSCNFFPLKKYNPIKIANYKTKEISMIKL